MPETPDDKLLVEFMNFITVEKGLAKNTQLAYRRNIRGFLKTNNNCLYSLSKTIYVLSEKQTNCLRGILCTRTRTL